LTRVIKQTRGRHRKKKPWPGKKSGGGNVSEIAQKKKKTRRGGIDAPTKTIL